MLDAGTKKQVVERVGEILVNTYAFPDAAREMRAFIASRLEKGEYQGINSPLEFGHLLTGDLRKIKNDLHLQVVYGPAAVRRIKDSRSQSVEERKRTLEERTARERRRNFGFEELKLLKGNVGYLRLTYFSSLRPAAEVCATAMRYLAEADAVILDLRSNAGGSHLMVKMISSYFVEDYTNLWNFEWQEDGNKRVEQHWTLPFVPGQPLFDKDVYILTSRSTFSAAEGFSHNMKRLKRATLIGENTQGGGVAGEWDIVNDSFTVFVPKYRSVDPLTNEYIDIEGKGVSPHMEVPAGRALLAAHLRAIDRAIGKAGPSKRENELRWIREWVEARSNPRPFDSGTGKQYVGRYEKKWEVYFDGACVYIRDDSSDIEYPGFISKLMPLSEGVFVLEETDSVRIRFERGEGGRIAAILLYANGGRVRRERQQ